VVIILSWQQVLKATILPKKEFEEETKRFKDILSLSPAKLDEYIMQEYLLPELENRKVVEIKGKAGSIESLKTKHPIYIELTDDRDEAENQLADLNNNIDGIEKDRKRRNLNSDEVDKLNTYKKERTKFTTQLKESNKGIKDYIEAQLKEKKKKIVADIKEEMGGLEEEKKPLPQSKSGLNNMRSHLPHYTKKIKVWELIYGDKFSDLEEQQKILINALYDIAVVLESKINKGVFTKADKTIDSMKREIEGLKDTMEYHTKIIEGKFNYGDGKKPTKGQIKYAKLGFAETKTRLNKLKEKINMAMYRAKRSRPSKKIVERKKPNLPNLDYQQDISIDSPKSNPKDFNSLFSDTGPKSIRDLKPQYTSKPSAKEGKWAVNQYKKDGKVITSEGEKYTIGLQENWNIIQRLDQLAQGYSDLFSSVVEENKPATNTVMEAYVREFPEGKHYKLNTYNEMVANKEFVAKTKQPILELTKQLKIHVDKRKKALDILIKVLEEREYENINTSIEVITNAHKAIEEIMEKNLVVNPETEVKKPKSVSIYFLSRLTKISEALTRHIKEGTKHNSLNDRDIEQFLGDNPQNMLDFLGATYSRESGAYKWSYDRNKRDFVGFGKQGIRDEEMGEQTEAGSITAGGDKMSNIKSAWDADFKDFDRLETVTKEIREQLKQYLPPSEEELTKLKESNYTDDEITHKFRIMQRINDIYKNGSDDISARMSKPELQALRSDIKRTHNKLKLNSRDLNDKIDEQVEDLTDLLSNISEGYTTNVEFNKYVKTQKEIITTIEVAKNTMVKLKESIVGASTDDIETAITLLNSITKYEAIEPILQPNKAYSNYLESLEESDAKSEESYSRRFTIHTTNEIKDTARIYKEAISAITQTFTSLVRRQGSDDDKKKLKQAIEKVKA
jgi:hypothetical protein